MRRTYREKQIRKDMLQGVALLVATVGIVLLCMWGFPRIDCSNARSGLAYIEQCRASESCELSERDINLEKAFLLQQAKACPNASGRD